MKILLTNDDGIDASGIRTLAEVLGAKHEVYLVAPLSQKSGFSHSVSYFYSTKTACRRQIEGAIEAYGIDGTPADCIYLGVYALLKEKPDVVISGINHGPNLSSDALYSGTVGAAAEGIVAGIPGLAVSLCTHEEYDFFPAAAITAKILERFMNDPQKLDYLLSVNVPPLSLSEIKGYKLTRFDAMRCYGKEVDIRTDDDGGLTLTTAKIPVGTGKLIGPEGDISAVKAGYVSLTPLTLDWTDYKQLERMRGMYKDVGE